MVGTGTLFGHDLPGHFVGANLPPVVADLVVPMQPHLGRTAHIRKRDPSGWSFMTKSGSNS